MHTLSHETARHAGSAARRLMWTLIVSALACGSPQQGQKTTPGTPTPSTQVGDATITLLHAVTDVDDLDVWIDGQKRATPLSYRHSSGNVTLPAGSHQIDLRLAGSTTPDGSVWSSGIYVQAGQHALLCALGRATDAKIAGSTTRLNVIAFALTQTVTTGSRWRLLHAAATMPAVSLLTTDGQGLTGADFAQVGAYADLNTAAGSIKLAVRRSSDTADMAYVTADPATLQATANHPQLAIAFGDESPLSDRGRFFGISLLDEITGDLRDLPLSGNIAGEKATFYVVHASPDAGAVDLISKANGARLFGALDYRQTTPLIQLVPVPYQLELRPASSPNVLVSAPLRPLPGTQFVMVIGGLQRGSGAQALRLFALPRMRPADAAGTSQRRAVHAIADAAPTARLTLTQDGPTFVDDTAPAAASAYRAADPSPGTLRMSIVGIKTTWDIDLPQVVVDAARGQILSLLVTGTLAEPRQPIAALAIIESGATTTKAPLVVPLVTSSVPVR